MNKLHKKIIIGTLIGQILLTSNTVFAINNPISRIEDPFGMGLAITLNADDYNNLEKVVLNGKILNKKTNKWSNFNQENDYLSREADNKIELNNAKEGQSLTLVISGNVYNYKIIKKDKYLNLEQLSNQEVPDNGSESDKKEADPSNNSDAENKNQNHKIEYTSSFLGSYFTITPKDNIENAYLKLNDNGTKKNGKNYFSNPGDYYIDKKSGKIYLFGAKKGDVVEINVDGQTYKYKFIQNGFDLIIEEFHDKKKEPEKHEPETNAEELKLNYKTSFGKYYIEISPNNILKSIQEDKIVYKRNGALGNKVGSSISVFKDNDYYIDKENSQIYVYDLKENDVITLILNDKENNFTLKKNNNKWIFEKKENHIEPTFIASLEGSFESAVVGQKKYDAMTGATGMVNQNTNSNVKMKITNVKEPKDSDWILFENYKGTRKFTNSRVEIAPEGSGMKPVFSKIDSSITLSGTPAKEGTYKIKVILEDDLGRANESNELEFKIFTNSGFLEDYLKKDNFTQTKDGRYMWDQEPWVINALSKDKNELKVPKELKAYFGSHKSGTYGILGTADGNIQNLMIEDGCDLTLKNMLVKRSVNIIVRNNGYLKVDDSSIYGKIIVEDGGKLSVNYDSYNNRFIDGASIQGQIILKDGAVLENSKIYSNTNNLTDGKKANRNVEPVVKVEGNAKIAGQVYIRGDESPTGTDPKTNKPYTGQLAMSIENAKLSLDDGAILGLYGGGKNATTTEGGTALVLNNGEIEGKGTLVTIGGDGFFKKGGYGISGKGKIKVSKALIQGGDSTGNVDEQAKGYDGDIKFSKETIGKVESGKDKRTLPHDYKSPYWNRGEEVDLLKTEQAIGNETINVDSEHTYDKDSEDIYNKIKENLNHEDYDNLIGTIKGLQGNVEKREKDKNKPAENDKPNLIPEKSNKNKNNNNLDFSNNSDTSVNKGYVKAVVSNNDNKHLIYKILIGKNTIQKIINDKIENINVEYKPYIKNNRTMLPVRMIAELLGANVEWDNETRTAIFTKDNIVCSIQIDGKIAKIKNDKDIILDAVPDNINNRIYLPLTNIANIFKLTNGNLNDGIKNDIEWDDVNKVVIIKVK